MEINRLDGDVKAAIATTAIVEGRMVCMTNHSLSADFGSNADLPGAKLPTTADEAKKARYVSAFPVTNQKGPFYSTYPSMAYALRGGWDQASNVPFNTDIMLSYPGNQESKTIASGTGMRLFAEGTFTLPSGQYVYSASLVPGASLSVASSGGNEGKLQYSATFDADTIVAFVEAINTTTLALTFTLVD